MVSCAPTPSICVLWLLGNALLDTVNALPRLLNRSKLAWTDSWLGEASKCETTLETKWAILWFFLGATKRGDISAPAHDPRHGLLVNGSDDIVVVLKRHWCSRQRCTIVWVVSSDYVHLNTYKLWTSRSSGVPASAAATSGSRSFGVSFAIFSAMSTLAFFKASSSIPPRSW